MALFRKATSPGDVGRSVFGWATAMAAVLGFGDPRWFAASGAFGTVWWAWDFLADNVFGPLGGWFAGMLTGTATVQEPPDLSLDDTVRLLESHLAGDAVPRHVQIQSALRLAEIYRLSRKDEARARDVIARVKAKWPDAPELQRFQKSVEQTTRDES